MPKRFERHNRAKNDWGAAGSRSAELRTAVTADPGPPRRAPGRKDTKRWCRGKMDVEHVPEIVLSDLRRSCRWWPRWSFDVHGFRAAWECYHEERCANCGKISRYLGSLEDTDCPDFPGDGQERQAAMAEAAKWNERHAGYCARKPVITGPQGYRRPRAG